MELLKQKLILCIINYYYYFKMNNVLILNIIIFGKFSSLTACELIILCNIILLCKYLTRNIVL